MMTGIVNADLEALLRLSGIASSRHPGGAVTMGANLRRNRGSIHGYLPLLEIA